MVPQGAGPGERCIFQRKQGRRGLEFEPDVLPVLETLELAVERDAGQFFLLVIGEGICFYHQQLRMDHRKGFFQHVVAVRNIYALRGQDEGALVQRFRHQIRQNPRVGVGVAQNHHVDAAAVGFRVSVKVMPGFAGVVVVFLLGKYPPVIANSDKADDYGQRGEHF